MAIKGRPFPQPNLAFSPDGKRLYTNRTFDRKVKVRDLASGEERVGFPAGILVAFSSDGTCFATDDDKTVKIVDLATGKVDVMLPTGKLESFNQLAFSTDGKRLACTSGVVFSEQVAVWNLDQRKIAVTLAVGDGAVLPLSRLAFSADAKRLALIRGLHKTVEIWSLDNRKRDLRLFWHTNTVKNVIFSRDGQRLATASEDFTVKVWNMATSPEAIALAGEHSIAFSPDSKRAAIAFNENVKVWDLSGTQEVLTFKHKNRVRSAAFTSDGRRLLTASFDDTVRVWDMASAKEVFAFPVDSATSWSKATFSADRTKFAIADWPTLKVWDTATGKRIFAVSGAKRDHFLSVAFSPDGKRIAAGSWPQPGVQIWDILSGEETLNLGRTFEPVNGIAFRPDGRSLAGISADGTLRIWNAKTGQETLNLRGHLDVVPPLAAFDRSVSVSFSPDGKRVATCSSDGTLRIWDAASGHLVLDFRSDTGWKQYRTWASVAFSPDGNYLASATGDGTVKIWNATPLPK